MNGFSLWGRAVGKRDGRAVRRAAGYSAVLRVSARPVRQRKLACQKNHPEMAFIQPVTDEQSEKCDRG